MLADILLKSPPLPAAACFPNSALPSGWALGMNGGHGAGRATLITCGPLPARHGTREPFREVITDIEHALDLHQHKPSALPRHAAYLHQRTASRIGSLTRLIRQAAITAICDGTERITKTTLDTIRLDHLAEQHNRPAPPTTANPTHTRQNIVDQRAFTR
ncbi:hypothetical protein ACIP10_34850 [Streptomyces galbus]|uniref:hypothetical protein n=1 Tax=Streptomyces galbus TaxID=33898 RepID=UPI0038268C94